MVFWLLGISGAGKSTLGKKLKTHFEENGISFYLIDGDEIRDFFENDLSYSEEDRVANIKRIIYAAYVLNRSGINVIVCNISPFERLRVFVRRKIENYYQIYVKKDLVKSTKDDVKNIYQNNLGITELVGINIKFEEPKNNDLIIDVDHQTVEESFNLLLKFISEKLAG